MTAKHESVEVDQRSAFSTFAGICAVLLALIVPAGVLLTIFRNDGVVDWAWVPYLWFAGGVCFLVAIFGARGGLGYISIFASFLTVLGAVGCLAHLIRLASALSFLSWSPPYTQHAWQAMLAWAAIAVVTAIASNNSAELYGAFFEGMHEEMNRPSQSAGPSEKSRYDFDAGSHVRYKLNVGDCEHCCGQGWIWGDPYMGGPHRVECGTCGGTGRVH